MRILVVFAHPKRNSFTGRILDSFVAGLEQAGHVAEVADLYSEGFQLYWDKELTESYIPRAHEIGRSAFGCAAAPDTADPRVPGSSAS